MQTIILPGFSFSNKAWAEEAQDKLGAEVLVYEWKHWVTGDESDFIADEEAVKIIRVIGSEKVNVLAKSIGTYVLMLLLARLKSNFQKIILCGIPLGFVKKNSLHLDAYKNLADFPAQMAICFQNAQDPLGSYEEIEKFVHEINPSIQVVSKPRNDHHYPYFTEFKQFLLLPSSPEL